MARLFVALWLPADAARHLADALGRPASPRWHLTLAFLGDADPRPVVTSLGALTVQPFDVALAGGGTFGGRVLWAGVGAGAAPLTALAAQVRARVGGDDLPFRPHVTLARGRHLRVPPALARYAGPVWRATTVSLVQSRRGAYVDLLRVGKGAGMSTPTDPPVEPLREDADATPRPEEVVADAGRDDVPPPREHPVAGGTDDSPPAQGEGAADSY